MYRFFLSFFLTAFFFLSVLVGEEIIASKQTTKKLVYIVSDIRIPFWEIMSRGITHRAKEFGYELTIMSAHNQTKQELENLSQALKDHVSGIVVSPTNSSACVTILQLAKKAQIPVVISDIGTDKGEYLSYIASDNRSGAYGIGEILVNKMKALEWNEGRVGIIAIPQKRANGQARTAGFMKALDEGGIKSAAIKQQVDFSYEETYRYTRELLEEYPNIRALWLQGSNQYKAALQAMQELGKEREVLLLTFDAEPEFIELIQEGKIVTSAMQQPYLMGEKAVELMHAHFNGEIVQKNIELPVLAVSSENIKEQLTIIKRNVLGIE